MPIPAPLASSFTTLGIRAPIVEHPPLRTVADTEAHWQGLKGMPLKNLFIKDAGKQYWLVVVPAEYSVDTKTLAPLIGSKRISFGSAEDLSVMLGVEPGAVTPLAVINDKLGRVRIVLHAAILAGEALLLHPLVNTATVLITPADLLRFLAAHSGTPAIIDLSSALRRGPTG